MQTTTPDYKKLYEDSLKTIQEYQQKLEFALFEANALRAKLFGPKSDNRVKKADSGQLDIFELGATEDDIKASEDILREEVVQTEKEQESKAAKRINTPRARKRMAIPEGLEREEQIIDPQEIDESKYKVIGQEETEILVYVPGHFKVKRIIRRKWALKDSKDMDSKGILIAPIPSRTVKRGLLDETVIAHLLTSKYVDHLPLYRQRKILEREGMDIPESTIGDNVAAGCEQIKPVYNALKREALANLYLQVDETGMNVLRGGNKNKCHKGYFWAYHAPVDGLVFFDYRQGRSEQGPREILKDFSGVIQTDAYAVYMSLFAHNKNINHYNCMAHIRREFDESVVYDKERATYAVKKIGELYRIEKEIRESAIPMTEAEIVNKRMSEALPVMAAFKEWMIEEYPKILPSSPIGKALAYALKLWDNMKYYTLQGHLQIDNNGIENAIRPIALGRKNFMFAGTHQTAQNAAMIYSLFATCKKHDVNPYEWLTDVLRKLNQDYDGKFSDLLPHRWKKFR